MLDMIIAVIRMRNDEKLLRPRRLRKEIFSHIQWN